MARLLVHILIILLSTVVLFGCEPQYRNRALTFFFTGVPPLDEVEQKKEISDESSRVATGRSVEPFFAQTLYSHPLWVAGACDPCHLTSSTYSIPGVPKKSVSVFKTGGGMVGELTLPKNKLCTQCHTDKTPRRALADNLWLHNTTAKGDCLACHDPHQSKNEKTLRQPPAKICTVPCHEKGEYIVTPVHQTRDPCLSCHNPHMGSNRNLLTKEYKEVKKTVTDIPGHPELDMEQLLSQ
ncbi:MAG: cytochrome c3 family protein [Desulforhopalus sp.]